MDRRHFVTATPTAIVAAGGLAAPALAQSTPQLRWRVTSSFPRSLDTVHGAAEALAQTVSELTDGRFQLRIYPAGELVPGLQAADAVTGGTVEAAFTTSYYYIGKDPTFIFATCLPFGMNPRQQTAWMLHGGGSELLADFYRSQNIVCLPAGNTACQMGGWFRREIRSLADLRGLKMRVGGLAGQVLARVGVVPQQLAGGDIYPALERGVIDAAEWIGPHDDEKLGFNRVAPFYYYPGWWEGGTQEHLFVNAAAWDGLPPSYQAALRTAGWYANTWLLAKFDTVNPPAMRRLLAQGAQLRPFPAEMTQACWREAHALYAEIAAANPTFRRVLEHYLAFRDEQYQWLQVAEYSYDTFMIRQLRART